MRTSTAPGVAVGLVADDAPSYPVGLERSTGWSYRNDLRQIFYNDQLVTKLLDRPEHPGAIEAIEKEMDDESDPKPACRWDKCEHRIESCCPLGMEG